MRADRRRWWFGIGLAAVVLATACGDGGAGTREEAGVERPARVVATTTAPPPATPTTVATATTVVTPSTTPTTSGRPQTAEPIVNRPDAEYVNDTPQVRAFPTRGPAGTRVRLEGYGFTDEMWRADGGNLWLSSIGGVDCSLMASAEHDLRVSGDGHLTGSFIVPEKGICRFSDGREVLTGGFGYHIAYQCTACQIGRFTVILPGESAEEPTGTPCDGWVGFGGGENLASEIYADGLSCEDAKTFVQAHGGSLGPIAGAAHIDADGFSCDRTGQSDRYLPRANYKCTRGAQAIFFIRT